MEIELYARLAILAAMLSIGILLYITQGIHLPKAVKIKLRWITFALYMFGIAFAVSAPYSGHESLYAECSVLCDVLVISGCGVLFVLN